MNLSYKKVNTLFDKNHLIKTYKAMKQIVEFSDKEQIEGVLAKWCWDNGYASSDEHEI